MNEFSGRLLEFYRSLDPNLDLTEGVSVIFPFSKKEVWLHFEQFCHKYYTGNSERILLLGINPGRFGAGITGIPFTDPYHLEKYCGIKNDFDKRKELSSIFIFDLIKRFGGLAKFYDKYCISSVCPLGFIKDNRNYNYYDDDRLFKKLKSFIVSSISAQMEFPCSHKLAFSLGKGKNYKFLSELNKEFKWFKEIIALPHPRWVMQYQSKNYENHIKGIVQSLKNVEF